MGILRVSRRIFRWRKYHLWRILVAAIATVSFLGVLRQYRMRSNNLEIPPFVFPSFSSQMRPSEAKEVISATVLSSTGFKRKTSPVSLMENQTRPVFSTLQPTLPPDEYWPKLEFKLVYPEIEPKLPIEHRYFLLVVVNTAAAGEKYFHRRQAIRQTWGNNTSIDNSTLSNWKVIFAMGKTRNTSLDYNVTKEAETYNDIVVGDFEDIYIHLIMKTFMSHLWAHTRCKYVLKTDDDVYVHVARLIEWITNNPAGALSRFYGGHVYKGYIVGRCVDHKWCISKKYYEKPVWPPFCAGAFHVLSSDLVPSLVNFTKIRRPFQMDDAYIGVATSEMNVKAVSIPGFDAYAWYSSECPYQRTQLIALGHKISPTCMIQIHRQRGLTDV